MKNKFLTLLGFAKKANQVTSGDEGVKAFLKKNAVKLLIIAEDYPEKRKNFWKSSMKEAGIDVLETCDKESLGSAIGTSPRALVAVLDQKMAESLKNIVRESMEVKEIDKIESP